MVGGHCPCTSLYLLVTLHLMRQTGHGGWSLSLYLLVPPCHPSPHEADRPWWVVTVLYLLVPPCHPSPHEADWPWWVVTVLYLLVTLNLVRQTGHGGWSLSLYLLITLHPVRQTGHGGWSLSRTSLYLLVTLHPVRQTGRPLWGRGAEGGGHCSL